MLSPPAALFIPSTTQHHHQWVLNSLSSISVAVFISHSSILLIYAIILLSDMALRLPGLSINRVFQSVWQTAAPFMSLTFPAGYWISKHTAVSIFCSSTIIKIVHLALCTDDSTYQVKHGIVKLCGPKSVLYGGKTLDVLLFCLFFCIFIFRLPTASCSCITEPSFSAVNVHICFLCFSS